MCMLCACVDEEKGIGNYGVENENLDKFFEKNVPESVRCIEVFIIFALPNSA